MAAMRRRLPELLLLALLLAALVQALLMLAYAPGEQRSWLALQRAGDPPGALGRPGGAEQVLRTRVAALGDYLTVEDLVRGALVLERGELEGAPALDDEERQQLAQLLEQAAAQRDELLRVEGEIRRLDGELAEGARQLAASLTPAQRAWVLQRRDEVSVDRLERAYWDELARLLQEEP